MRPAWGGVGIRSSRLLALGTLIGVLLAAGACATPIGVSLTEGFMMGPEASVSALVFHHPDARYFSVGKIGRDQVEDYARRKGMTAAEAERWLRPNLGYDD